MTAALTDSMCAFIDEWRLGHIATVGPAGPNVSPKGTFQALDAGRVAFAEIRSPQTKANLAHDPRVDVNMVDVFSRKGLRFSGEAAWHGPETALFSDLAPRWTDLFGAPLAAHFKGFVEIRLTQVKPLSTPAYDVGATERQLRQDYLDRFTAMQREALGV